MIKNIFTLPFLSKSLCSLVSAATLTAFNLTASVASADEFSLGFMYGDRHQFLFFRVKEQTGGLASDVDDDNFFTPIVGLYLGYKQQAPGSNWSQTFDFSFNIARRTISGLHRTGDLNRKEAQNINGVLISTTNFRQAHINGIVTKATAAMNSFNLSYINSYDVELLSVGPLDFVIAPSFGAAYSYYGESYDFGSFDKVKLSTQNLGTVAFVGSSIAMNLAGGNRLVYESNINLLTLFERGFPGLRLDTNAYNFESENNEFYYNPANKNGTNNYNLSSATMGQSDVMFRYEMNSGMNISFGKIVRSSLTNSDFVVKVGFDY